jgi:mRNA interferase MazF
MSTVQRGEVYKVIPDPSVGKEIQKERPCVVVSSNILNAKTDLAIVCPITEGMGLQFDIIHIQVKKGEGGATKESVALCDQVKAVDQGRLMEKRGHLEADTMRKIDKGLKVVLDLR